MDRATWRRSIAHWLSPRIDDKRFVGQQPLAARSKGTILIPLIAKIVRPAIDYAAV